MNALLKKIVVFTLVVNTLSHASETALHAAHVELEIESPLRLMHDGNGFNIIDTENGERKLVQQYNLHRDLRDLDTNRLRLLALNSHFVARQDGNGDYHLIHYPRLKSGTGPITAWAAEGITRAVLWTLPFVLGARMLQKTLTSVKDSVDGSEIPSRIISPMTSDVPLSYATDNIATNPGWEARAGMSALSSAVNEGIAYCEKIPDAQPVLNTAKGLTAAYAAESVAVHATTLDPVTAAEMSLTKYGAFVEFVAKGVNKLVRWIPISWLP